MTANLPRLALQSKYSSRYHAKFPKNTANHWDGSGAVLALITDAKRFRFSPPPCKTEHSMMTQKYNQIRKNAIQRKNQFRRQLRVETLELRQLLAADVLFVDSFEVGEWNGQWVEDSQNDWFRSTQRATDGSRSAEVDGSANNATLTLATPLDLSGYSTAELTFSWYIESSWDSGEFIAVDVFNGSWQEVDRLRGNVDAENTWHHETVSLDSYLTEDFLVRFRASVSASDEDGNVDNVKIVGTPTVVANQAPLADAGEDQTLNDAGGNSDEFVMLTGIGSDSDGTIASYEWREGTTILGTTAKISPTLAVGTHTLTLTVTDDDGASATDTVVITINEVLAKPVKVFILAGQSNITGTARVENLDPSWNVPQDDVWIWLDHNMDGGQWTTLAPGHGLSTHAPRPNEPEGLDPRNALGPELSLASILADAYPDHRIALIKHGDGGRDLASHFNPENIGPPESSDHMWSGLLKKADDAFAVLDAAGATYDVEGVFLALGGGDARNKNSDSSDPNEVLAGEEEALERSAAFAENLTTFIHALRNEFSDDLPVVMALGEEDVSPELLEIYPGIELVRQGQLEVAETVPWTDLFSTAGITLSDAVHYDAMGQIEFGTRFANTYLNLVSTSTTSISISFPDFSDTTGLNLIRDASVANSNTLRLTPAASGKEGAVWYAAEKQFVALPWETTFAFNLNENSSGTSGGSDGFTFAIQNSDPTYVAGGGHHLGYTSLANSLVIEFDTAQSLGDPSGSHISVHTNGTGPNGWEESLSLGSFNTLTPMDDATTHTAKIRYTNGELSVFLDDLVNPVLVVPVDLDSLLDLDQGRAWVGFTASTGGGYQNHDILNWSYKVLVDTSTTVAVGDVALVEGSSGASQMVFDITRLGDTSAVTTVAWETSDGSAIAGVDYTTASGLVSFAPGEIHKTVSVAINGDSVDEAHETLFVKLSNSVGGSIADLTGIGSILNDDSTISISDATATEGDTSFRFIDAFVADRSGLITEPQGVTFGPDGNLYVGHHGLGVVKRFHGATGQFIDIFADGSDVAEEVAQVVFHGDYLFAATAESILRFEAITGAPAPAFGKSGALFATPVDQGVSTGVRSLTFGPDGDLYVTSSTANQVLRYHGTSGAFVSVFVPTGSGGVVSANALTFGVDGHLYVASLGTNAVLRYQGPLEPNPGAYIDTFVASGSGGISRISTGGLRFGPDGDLYVVSVDNGSVLRFDGLAGTLIETVVEPGEGGLTSARGMTFDSEGRLYVASGGSNEILRYAATSEAAFTISLSNPSALPVNVTYATANGSAIAGDDYVTASGTTFTPGQTTLTVFVRTLDDVVYEGTETFVVNLSNPVGAIIADTQGVGTIFDNDTAPTKFYVVDDASANRTYEYGPTGSAVENYSLNSGNSAPRGAASMTAGDKVWVVDANKKVFVYNDSGTLLGSWTASSLAGNATVEGIATNGTDVWIVDARQDRVYRYTNAASRLSGSQSAVSSFALNSGNRSPKDIVTDGTHLWVIEDSSTDKVFKYTVAGSLVGSWTISGGGNSPTGLTIDPSGASQSIWIVDSATDRVYEYTNSRSRDSGSQAAAVSFALAVGNTNPQGIADPPVAGADPAAADSIAEEPGNSARNVPAIAVVLPSPNSGHLASSLQQPVTTTDPGETKHASEIRTVNQRLLPSSGVTDPVWSDSSRGSKTESIQDSVFDDEAFQWLDESLLTLLAQRA